MSELNKSVLAGHLLDALYFSVRDGKKIDNIPGLIEQLLAEDIWKTVYVEETERTITYEHFEDFVTTPPPEGLGTKIKVLERLIGDDEVTLNLLDAAIQGKPGKKWDSRTVDEKNTVYDIHSKKRRPAGTSRMAGLRRLRLHRPDLLELVLSKEMTVNQAMIKAGFRKKRIMVYAEVEPVVAKLKKEFNDEQLKQIIEMLQNK